MLCELAVDNIGTYIDVITQIDAEQQYRMWFRGQSDYSWGLVPSVQRKDGMGKHYEQYITTNFMIHTMRLNPNAPQRYDRASWLTLMQHYGLPTRLLDWSESPLVALYFALSSDKDAKTDAAVWVLNPMELNKKVGYGEYVPPISYDSLSGDLEGAFSNAEKTESKIAELEEYLRNVRAAQKKEEDNEIVRAIRSTKLGGRDLLALLENIQAGNVTFQTTVNNENKTSEEAEMEDVIAKDA